MSPAMQEVRHMDEFDIFSNSYALHAFSWIALALLAVQIELFSLVAHRMPRQLPRSIVRRAL